MPNYVKCKLRFSYPNEKLNIKDIKNAFINYDENNSEYVDFEKVIPSPANMFRGSLGEKQIEYCKSQNIPNWYDWQKENWGVKWNASESEIHETEDELLIKFTTAWSVPKPVLNKLFSKFPNVDIDFAAVGEGGFVCYYYHYSSDDKETKEYDLSQIDGVHSLAWFLS